MCLPAQGLPLCFLVDRVALAGAEVSGWEAHSCDLGVDTLDIFAGRVQGEVHDIAVPPEQEETTKFRCTRSFEARQMLDLRRLRCEVESSGSCKSYPMTAHAGHLLSTWTVVQTPIP